MSRIFKTLPALPLYNPSSGNPPADGMALKTNEFCRKKYGETCKKFYDQNRTEGFYQCPYGFAVRVFQMNGQTVYFSSLLIEGVSDQKKLKQGERQPLVSLTKDFVDGVVNQIKSFQEVRSIFNELKRNNQHLSDTMHEMRNYNSQLKANCQSVSIDTNQSVNRIEKIILSNISISQMITSRLDYLVYNVNPSQSSKEKTVFFKKVDKVIQTIRAEANAKQVKIEQHGPSSFREVLAFSFIEQLPAVLIQNAVKYALPSTPVKVELIEGFKNLTFAVENTGPHIHDDEKEKIFQKGYRGREARTDTDGTGTGLWFMKRIVDIHAGDILLKIGNPSDYNGKKVSTIRFEVKLELI